MSATLYQQWLARFEAIESELNALDAAIGDGDHGSTMLKGLRAASQAPDASVKAFRRAAGGASGSLFSLVLRAFERTANEHLALGDTLQEAADRISEIGDAVAGDKTLLDALLPAAQAARQSLVDTALNGDARAGTPQAADNPVQAGDRIGGQIGGQIAAPNEVLQAAQNAQIAARNGAEASVAMVARRGRARHVEGAGVGHMDAGARSVAELLTVFLHWQSVAVEEQP